MPRPDLSRVPAYFHNYINQVNENDLAEAIQNQTKIFFTFLSSIPSDKIDFSYAHGKWTIKEVLQHIIDAERVFAYRALCFARKDSTPLPGFDENSYADNSKAAARNWVDMVEEFKYLRQSSTLLFKSFDSEQLDAVGIANSNSNYVLGIGFILVGHVNHHMAVITNKYL